LPQTAREPHPVDIEVGRRIRLQRKILRMSQTTLAEALGLTFQQVQKYEKGTNRVGSSRLSDIARTLGVPVSFFSGTAQMMKAVLLKVGRTPIRSQAFLIQKRVLLSISLSRKSQTPR